MTDEVIEMAKLAVGNYEHAQYWPFFTEELEHFAKLVAAKERERIANQIDRMPFGDTAASFAVWIRAGAP